MRLGMRLLNPCKEMDYGAIIFEDPDTHELVGSTPIARYHIDILDLNNPSLVLARKERSELRALLDVPVLLKNETALTDPGLQTVMKALQQILGYKIPNIPAPPTARIDHQ